MNNQPINWRKTLNQLEYGKVPKRTLRQYFVTASEWHTCAVGTTICERIETSPFGCPADDALFSSGKAFSDYIKEMMNADNLHTFNRWRDNAIQMLDKIEKRYNEILNQYY